MPIQANPNAASHGRMEVMFLKTPIHVLTKPRPGTCNQDKNKLITTSWKRPLSHVTRKWDVFSVSICSGSRDFESDGRRGQKLKVTLAIGDEGEGVAGRRNEPNFIFTHIFYVKTKNSTAAET